MNPTQALNVLAIVTEPNFKFARGDYVNVQTALETLKALIEAQPKPAETPATDAPKS